MCLQTWHKTIRNYDIQLPRRNLRWLYTLHVNNLLCNTQVIVKSMRQLPIEMRTPWIVPYLVRAIWWRPVRQQTWHKTRRNYDIQIPRRNFRWLYPLHVNNLPCNTHVMATWMKQLPFDTRTQSSSSREKMKYGSQGQAAFRLTSGRNSTTNDCLPNVGLYWPVQKCKDEVSTTI